MITNGKPFKKLSEIFYQYVELFNLDHYRGPPRFSFNQGMSIIDNVVTFLLTWGEETRERIGLTATQGTQLFLNFLRDFGYYGNCNFTCRYFKLS